MDLIYIIIMISLIFFCGGLLGFVKVQTSNEKDNIGAFFSIFSIMIGFILLAKGDFIANKLTDLAITFAKSL